MIEKLTPIDAAILVAAAVMALGAFCPIVHLPIVGTLNYVAGGRGDGFGSLYAQSRSPVWW